MGERYSQQAVSSTPIAIGGLGGSGTRLVAQIFTALGYHLGNDLNEASDNLLFTLLFKRKNLLSESDDFINRLLNILIFSLRNEDDLSDEDLNLLRALTLDNRPSHPKKWLESRFLNVKNQITGNPQRKIAWKEPNTHVLLDSLIKHSAGIKYLHVLRDGKDMAFSGNQHQLQLWGEHFLKRPINKSPVDALDFWNATHARIFATKAKHPLIVEVVSFDKLCQGDQQELAKIYQFADINPSADQLTTIRALIKPPETIGRAEHMDTSVLDDYSLQQYRTLMQQI